MKADWAEPVQSGDRYADYCQWHYEPPAPVGGKYRQVSLLWAALDVAGADPALRDACESLRRRLGAFQTVYGVKLAEGRLSFEFYFYDYDRTGRWLSVPRVLDALSSHVRCDLPSVEKRPYFMFSIDLTDDIVTGRAPLEEIDVYIGNPGSTVSSGICYAQRADGLELKNFYFFFDAQDERPQITAKVATNVYRDAETFPLTDILWPEMVDCGVIVVANKRRFDGVYFSRVTAAQLQTFFARTGWPAQLQQLFSQHIERFDHLLYDTGVDYVVEQGRIRVLKSAFYGLL